MTLISCPTCGRIVSDLPGAACPACGPRPLEWMPFRSESAPDATDPEETGRELANALSFGVLVWVLLTSGC